MMMMTYCDNSRTLHCNGRLKIKKIWGEGMPPDVTSNREGTPPPHSHTLDASDVSMLPPTFNSSLQYLGMYKHPARHCDLAVQNDTATQFPFIGHMTQM